MKNNVLGKISMQSAKLPSSRFNKANDFATSTQFGVVSPTHVKYMHAGTKKVVSDECLYYLAPLVVPTFTRLKAKLYHQFVRLSDLFPRTFNSLMSQTPVGLCVGGIQKPTRLPTIDMRLLSAFALFGSRCCVYYGDSNYTAGSQALLLDLPLDTKVTAFHQKELGTAGDPDTELYTAFYTGSTRESYASGTISGRDTIFSVTGSNESASWASASLNAFGCTPPTDTLLLNPCALLGITPPSGGKCLIPLGQQFQTSLISDFSPSDAEKEQFIRDGEDLLFYNPGNCDVCITKYFDYSTTSSGATTWHRRRFYYCFKLSDYGKRYKSFLEGIGYKLNFFTSHQVSFAPIVATYKAYYNLFSINLFENWDNSTFGYICNNIDNGAFASVYNSLDSDVKTVNSVGGVARCLFALGDTFYTEEQDYLSSHTSNNAVSPAAPTGMIHCDVVSSSNMTAPDSSAESIVNPTPNSENGHVMINNANHGQLDAEFLMKAYRWVNRNTIAGQRIAELLRAQGLGDYVDTCKPDFIGYDETPLVINEVVSQSDTYSQANNTGAQLGQRGAKGIGYNEGKKSFTFTADEIGFWITLSTIVPVSGYCQGMDPVITELVRKEDFFLPDFDSVGMEATRFLSIVCEMKDNGKPGSLRSTFGYAPQQSRFKVARNKISGNFSLPSEQDNFLPYELDKYIPLDKLTTKSTTVSGNPLRYDAFTLHNPVAFTDIPTAGVAWRYIGKYLYLQNFNRMFSYQGESSKLMTGANGNNWSEFVIRDADNFFYHMIDNDQEYANMKPIEASYETDDDGKTNTSMDKA